MFRGYNASAADELFEPAPERARGLLRDVLRLADGRLVNDSEGPVAEEVAK